MDNYISFELVAKFSLAIAIVALMVLGLFFVLLGEYRHQENKNKFTVRKCPPSLFDIMKKGDLDE